MSVAIRFGVLIAIVGLCGGMLGYSIIQEATKHAVAEPAPVDSETLARNNAARRDRIARQVAAGQLSLLKGAAQLRHFGLASCCQLESDSSQSFEERLCCHVIELAVATVKDSAAAEILQQRLEKELGDARDGEGRIMLPSPKPFIETLEVSVAADIATAAIVD